MDAGYLGVYVLGGLWASVMVGLIDMEAPPERVTISTVNEEEIMLREWRQMWDAALRRM